MSDDSKRSEILESSVKAHDQRQCECALCQRFRKFSEIIKDLCEVDKQWMRGFLDSVIETEFQLEMEQHYVKELKSKIAKVKK